MQLRLSLMSFTVHTHTSYRSKMNCVDSQGRSVAQGEKSQLGVVAHLPFEVTDLAFPRNNAVFIFIQAWSFVNH